MRKISIISILFILLLALCTNISSATTSKNLSQELYSLGVKYGATASDKVALDRYLADHNVTDSEADSIMAKAREGADLMDKAGVKDLKELSEDQKKELQSIANQATSILGITVSVKDGNVIFTDENGKTVYERATNGSSSKLVYTGNDYTIAIVAGTTVVALIAMLIVRKKVVNA